jgi:hypothetical protein
VGSALTRDDQLEAPSSVLNGHGYLQGLENRVLTEVAATCQPEIRWHVAQLVPGLALTPPQRARAITILRGFVDDDSRIVWTCAMQALADLAGHDEQLRGWVRPLLAVLTRTGTPAIRSRGRKLLTRLEQPGVSRPPAGGTRGGMTQADEDAAQ